MESEKGEIMPGFNGILMEKCKCMWYEGERE